MTLTIDNDNDNDNDNDERHTLGSAVADIERVYPAYRSDAVRFHHRGDEENSPVYRAYPEGHNHQPPGEQLVLYWRVRSLAFCATMTSSTPPE